MINDADNPVEWASLLTELDDAREHLVELVGEMTDSGSMDEADFSVQMGHLFAHLNRAWNCRNLTHQIPEDEWRSFSSFPADLEPVG